MTVRLFGNGRYVLGDRLGVGGMGVVYEAEDLARTEPVAVKIGHASLRADVIAVHMARELRAGRATHHPNVVGFVDGGTSENRPFIVMDVARGRTLSALAADTALSVQRIVAIVDQILAGLSAIHEAGFVHGDVKPDNVLVDVGDRVTIIDLGLACEQAPRVMYEDEIVISGTPHYLAPELTRRGAKTVASELYAVGVVLYELLTGTPPFVGSDMAEILRKHVEDEVIPPSRRAPGLNLPLALEGVVLRALQKRPRDRYATAAELRAALSAATTNAGDALTKTHPFSTTGPTLDLTAEVLRRSRTHSNWNDNCTT